ncbi:MAG: hypothetical protein RR397_07985 [Odoribacter sp.]
MQTVKVNSASTVADQKTIIYYPRTIEEAQKLVSQEITALCEMRVQVMTVVCALPSKELDFMKNEIFESWDQFKVNLYEAMDHLMTVSCRLEELRVSKNITSGSLENKEYNTEE